MNRIRERNPFLDDYLRQEVEWYGRPSGPNYIRPGGHQLNDYLNVNWRDRADFEVPVMARNGVTWMSLTWMEVQSLWPALVAARGHTATIGLGLGYFALRAAEKPNVDRMTVFEIDLENIDWFRREFSDRPGFDKIEFVHGDARETCLGMEFDLLFADPYPLLGDNDIPGDIRLFTQRNSVDEYRFWGLERFLADAFEEYGMIDVRTLRPDDKLFFKYWLNTDLCSFRRDHFCEEYVETVLTEMGVI